MQTLLKRALVGLPLLIGCQQEPGATPVNPSDPGDLSSTIGPEGRPSMATAEPTEPGRPITTASGLVYETLSPGSGPTSRAGDRVTIHYSAALEGSEPFDDSRESGEPWTYTIGDKRAVQGFNEGVAGMKVGETRRLIVPSNLAFGALGTFAEYAPGRTQSLDGAMQADEQPSIPPNATLVFEVEMLAIEGDDSEDATAMNEDDDLEER